MARKGNLFGVKLIQKKAMGIIVDRAIRFEFDGPEAIKTNEELTYQALVNALINISKEKYDTKSCISDRLLDDILDEEPSALCMVYDEMKKLSGYECGNITDKVYLLIWAALSSKAPQYKTVNEFRKSLAA